VNDEALIDEIVRHVMKQLHAGGVGARSDGKPGGTSSDGQSVANSSSVVLRDAVITAEILEKQAPNTKTLRIGPRSILTPSARDYLRTHDIQWLRAAGDTGNAASPAMRWRAIVVAASSSLDAALGDAKLAGWSRQLSGCGREAADAAVGALCRAEIDGAVILCKTPAAAACRSNRNNRIRAAVASSAADVREIARTMGANLYCIDPSGKSGFELRGILLEIASAPARPFSDWKE
jgi:hypothetical protein